MHLLLTCHEVPGTLSRVKQQQQQNNTKHIIENSYNAVNRDCNRISVHQ